jgi:hypothetical protein
MTTLTPQAELIEAARSVVTWEMITDAELDDDLRTAHTERGRGAGQALSDAIDWLGACLQAMPRDGRLPIEEYDPATHGEEILAFLPPVYGWVVLKYFKCNGVAAWRDWDCDPHYPTHFMPLPAPPEGAS